MRKRIYFDANASAPLLPEARDAVVAALALAANASSVHAEGRKARELVESARSEVAGSVSARPGNVVFTSGATEAAALALTPALIGPGLQRPTRLYVGATEHPSVLAGGRFPSAAVTRIPVRPSGALDLPALERTLDAHPEEAGPPYLALMLANNETGVIHPVGEAARLVKSRGGYLFCDAVQALGRIQVDMRELGADFLALSAHKIGGPQGAGALVLADERVYPEPLLTGGGQERRRRSGTENVAAIAGFGVAARLAKHHLSEVGRIAGLRDRLEAEVLASSPDVKVVGSATDRLPNTAMLAQAGLPSEIAVIALDLEGVAVSAGSACSSGKVGRSHVLDAMGLPAEVGGGGIRVSLPPDASEADVDCFIAAWRAIQLRMRPSRAA